MSDDTPANSAPVRNARANRVQPLVAVGFNDALLNIPTVRALTGLGRTSIYERIKIGEFKPIKLGKRATRFRASDVKAWLQAQAKDSA